MALSYYHVVSIINQIQSLGLSDFQSLLLKNLKTHTQNYSFKGGLLLKIKKLHIHLYFIATKYLQNNAVVEHIENWTKYDSLV